MAYNTGYVGNLIFYDNFEADDCWDWLYDFWAYSCNICFIEFRNICAFCASLTTHTIRFSYCEDKDAVYQFSGDAQSRLTISYP